MWFWSLVLIPQLLPEVNFVSQFVNSFHVPIEVEILFWYALATRKCKVFPLNVCIMCKLGVKMLDHVHVLSSGSLDINNLFIALSSLVTRYISSPFVVSCSLCLLLCIWCSTCQQLAIGSWTRYCLYLWPTLSIKFLLIQKEPSINSSTASWTKYMFNVKWFLVV